MGFCRKLKKVMGTSSTYKQKPRAGKEEDSPKRSPRLTRAEAAGVVPVLTENSNDMKGSYSYWSEGGEVEDGTDEAFSNYIKDTKTKMSVAQPAASQKEMRVGSYAVGFASSL